MRTSALTVLLALSVLPGCSALFGALATRSDREPETAPGSGSARDRRASRSPGDEGYVDPGAFGSPGQEALAGRVGFARKPVQDGVTLVSEARLGEPLHLRFVTADAPINARPGCTSDSPLRLLVRASLVAADGKKVDEVLESRKLGGELDLRRVDASPTGSLSIASASDWSREVSELAAHEKVVRALNQRVLPHVAEGDNVLTVRVTADCTGASADDPVLAEGSVTLRATAAEKKAYLAKFGTQVQKAANPKLAALAPQVRELWEQDKAGHAKGQTLGVRVISAAWQKVRSEATGVVMHERVQAAIVVRPGDAASEDVCALYWLDVEREPSGGALRAGTSSGPSPFVCGNAPR